MWDHLTVSYHAQCCDYDESESQGADGGRGGGGRNDEMFDSGKKRLRTKCPINCSWWQAFLDLNKKKKLKKLILRGFTSFAYTTNVEGKN